MAKKSRRPIKNKIRKTIKRNATRNDKNGPTKQQTKSKSRKHKQTSKKDKQVDISRVTKKKSKQKTTRETRGNTRRTSKKRKKEIRNRLQRQAKIKAKLNLTSRSKKFQQARQKFFDELENKYGKFWKRKAALQGKAYKKFTTNIRRRMKVLSAIGGFVAGEEGGKFLLIEKGKYKGQYSFINPKTMKRERMTARKVHNHFERVKKKAQIDFIVETAGISPAEAAEYLEDLQDDEDLWY